MEFDGSQDSPRISFRVAQDDFADAVNWVAKNLPQKPVQPVLRGLVITADDDGLTIEGFDYEVSTRVHVNAHVLDTGRIAVAGRLLSEVVSVMTPGTVEVATDENATNLLISSGSARFTLPLIPLEDYPKLPAIPQASGSVDPHEFTVAVSQVANAAGRDDALPMLTGIHVEIQGTELIMAATDRFRLAIRHLQWEPTLSEAVSDLLIPAKTLQETARSLDSGLKDPLTIAIGENLVGMVTENRQTTTRLLDADFPNIKPLLPKVHNYLASVDVNEMLRALKSVSIVAEKSGQVKLTFTAHSLVLEAANTDTGVGSVEIPAAFVGVEDSLQIAFNPAYLRDGLGVMHSDRALFAFTDAHRSAILVPEPDELPEAQADGSFPAVESDLTYLLMPVRLPSM